MIEPKRASLVRPTLQTRYHIDFDWWSKNDQNWRVYLRNYLCTSHQKAFVDIDVGGQVDFVDPDTAEVHCVDGMQHVLITHCARQPDFILGQGTLVDSVFRLLLANGNVPMNSSELAERLGRQPMVVLKTLSGLTVYKGLRPCLE